MFLDMIILGDSIMWGQGLQDQDKFWVKTQNAITSQFNTTVIPHLYAHSGARIIRAGDDPPDPTPGAWNVLWGEIPTSPPSILAQLAKAQADLPACHAGQPCLMLVDGGINDLSLPT